MKRGLKYYVGHVILAGQWVIRYYKPSGDCQIFMVKKDHTYESINVDCYDCYKLIDFEPPPMPVEPKEGEWWEVEEHGTHNLRQYDGEERVLITMEDAWDSRFPRDVQFIRRWKPVE